MLAGLVLLRGYYRDFCLEKDPCREPHAMCHPIIVNQHTWSSKAARRTKRMHGCSHDLSFRVRYNDVSPFV